MLQKDTWHVEPKHILQPPQYLIAAVNRFNNTNNKFNKNRNLIHVDLNITLGLYTFNVQATIDHHVHSVYCGHYTVSFNSNY